MILMGKKTREYCKALHQLFDEQMVLVYTMGKVGSSAVEDWLGHAFHTHTLYGHPPSPPFHIRKYGKIGFLVRRYTVYPLKRAMIRARPRVKIVTFFRDPRDRNPSMFMHDLPFWLTNYICDHGVPSRVEDSEFLLTAYKKVFPHDYPGLWVRNELSRFTGIATEDLWLGNDDYRIVTQGRYSVFIGRAEKLTECLATMAEFLDIPQRAHLARINRGAAKWYAPLYRDFLQSLRADASIDYAEDFRRANGYVNTPQA